MEPIVYIQLDGLGPRYAQLIRALKSAILESLLAAKRRRRDHN